MRYYNIVLRPPENLEIMCVEHAQKILGDVHNGYCLEKQKALPHITLLQFNTSEGSIEAEIDRRLKAINTSFYERISFTGFYATPRHAMENVHLWVGLEVKKTPALQDLHETIVSSMEGLDIVISNPIKGHYWPHLTLGRINSGKTIRDVGLDPALWARDGFKGWTVRFRKSDKLGQYLSTIS